MQNRFSKIILGTVQLGMPYGIGRWAEQLMPEKEAFRILDAAWERGITSLDTSPDYGVAEERIARYLVANPGRHFHIISKVKDLPSDSRDVGERFKRWLLECPFEANQSCRSLSLMLHKESDIYRAEVVEQLNILQEHGKLLGWGVSLYSEATALDLTKFPGCSMVQLPFSALDQAFARKGVIKLLSDGGISVFARSVFLKGLLQSSRKKLQRFGSDNVDILTQLQTCLKKQGFSVNDFAMSFALSEEGVNHVVLGADSAEQVNSWEFQPEPIETFNLPDNLRLQLQEHHNATLNPQFW